MSQVRLYPLSLMLIIGGCAGPMGQIRSEHARTAAGNLV